MIGFSLAPGGLLLPYHVGVLSSLEYHGFLHSDTPIAGSSAGSIATIAHAAGVDPLKVLDATIRVSDQCEAMGGAPGRLLPFLKQGLETLVDEERFEQLQSRQGLTGVCYRELFPRNVPILQTTFENRQDMFNAVCHSCTFPFFATPWPVALDTSTKGLPRVLVDGFFATPRDRFGCPCFQELAGLELDRTVTISAMGHEQVGLTASKDCDRIGPSSEADMNNLLRLATQASSAKELTQLYESGLADAEEWCVKNKVDTGQKLILAKHSS